MAKMNALNAKPVRQPAPLKVTLLWSPQGVHGVAMTAVDVLKVMHGLASMRQAGAVAEPVWRWRSGSGGLVPRWPQTLSSLPTTPYRALPDLLLVPGWHAFNGPHLDQLVHQAADAVALIQRVHAAGACVLAVGNGVALLGLAGLLRDREAVAPWQFVQAVLRHSEGVRLQTDRPWTVSDRIWTCETPLWTTEMLLDALKTTRGAELAVAASHVLLHSPERQQVAAQIEQDVHARRVPPGWWRGHGAGWRPMWPNPTTWPAWRRLWRPAHARCCATLPAATSKAPCFTCRVCAWPVPVCCWRPPICRWTSWRWPAVTPTPARFAAIFCAPVASCPPPTASTTGCAPVELAGWANGLVPVGGRGRTARRRRSG